MTQKSLKFILWTALIWCFVSLWGCINQKIQDPNIWTWDVVDVANIQDDRLSQQNLSTVRWTLQAAIGTIQNKDYQHFAELIDPEEWIQFFQYAYNANADGFRLTKSSIIENDPSTKYVRWTYDGSWFPIEMTIDEYFSEFVNGPRFDEDLWTEFTVNEMREWLWLERLPNLYPDWVFVQYNYSWSEEFQWFDWETLYIILNQTDWKRKIVAILHDQRTV